MEKIIICDFNELEHVVYKSNDFYEIIGALKIIKQLKLQSNNDLQQHTYLTHFECIIRQKIYSFERCTIDEAKSQLNKALNCAEEVYKIISNNNIKFINPLAPLLEKACILSELGRFDDHIQYLNYAIKLFKFIRMNKNADNQLINLSRMNEAKNRVDLASNNVNPLKNSIKALELSEKCRNYFKGDSRQKITFLNQYHAIHEIIKIESYGFEIESKEMLKKFATKIEDEITINSLKIDIDLIELGIKSYQEFDSILNKFNTLKENFYPGEYNYFQSIIFERNYILKKQI